MMVCYLQILRKTIVRGLLTNCGKYDTFILKGVIVHMNNMSRGALRAIATSLASMRDALEAISEAEEVKKMAIKVLLSQANMKQLVLSLRKLPFLWIKLSR